MLLIGWRNPYPYAITGRCCGLWLHHSVPTCYSGCWVFVWMVAFRYRIVNSKNIDCGTFLYFFYVLDTFIVYQKKDTLSVSSWNWNSTECQRLLFLHFGYSGWEMVVESPKWYTVCLYWLNRKRYVPCHILKMSGNRASVIFGLVCQALDQRLGCCDA